MRLRPYKSCDAKIIAGWCKDEETFYKWSGGRFGSYPVSAETIDDKYRNCNGDCTEEDNFYPMTAFCDEGIIGHLIMRYIGGDNKILRFGWVIVDGDKRGKGYGKKMLQTALRYAFEILKVDMVTIGVFDNNPSAYHCYKSVGFQETGMEELTEINGQAWKVIELEIGKDEYFK